MFFCRAFDQNASAPKKYINLYVIAVYRPIQGLIGKLRCPHQNQFAKIFRAVSDLYVGDLYGDDCRAARRECLYVSF